MATLAQVLPFPPLPPTNVETKWFSPRGCVVVEGDEFRVFIGGNLVGQFERGDRATRDLLLVCLCEEPSVHLGKLVKAFEVSRETLRRLRQLHQAEGIEAVVGRPSVGAPQKLTPQLQMRIEKMFEQGLTIAEAHARLRRGRRKISLSAVGMVHRDWVLRGRAAADEVDTGNNDDTVPHEADSHQASLDFDSHDDDAGCEPEPACASEAPIEPDEVEPNDDASHPRKLVTVAPRAVPHMQHAGAWLIIALIASWGIYARAEQAVSRSRRLASSALRIALDAVIAALAIEQRCVEGVRRLATSTAALLLLTRRCPSASWVRNTLARAAADGGGFRFHLDVAHYFASQVQASTADERPVVFYVDNHMRAYTGKHVIRKGWRMQDRRARPGCSDYYVHDEDGRPVMRLDIPEHDSLTKWLPMLAQALREALGPDERILIGFDRGGAHANHMMELRECNFEFVTYERKPYRKLPIGAFDQEFTVVDENGETEKILVCDRRMNLGKGRGRVRRIALLMESGEQLNLLANSKLDPASLYLIITGRWCQENGFKHGNERWGINQLDGRIVEPVPPDTEIPNPARRRLNRAIEITRREEGRLRCELAQLGRNDPKREGVQDRLDDAVRRLQELVAQRPSTPIRAPLKETELAGKLVCHPGEYKTWIDTIRIACANAESELALRLAPHLPRAGEAKKILANIFKAPGQVQLSADQIFVTLEPAGTSGERDAMRELLRQCSAMDLSLPGDPKGRKLRFRLQ